MVSRRSTRSSSSPTPDATGARDRRLALIVVLLVAAVAGGLYGSTLDAPFIYDDVHYIVRNESIRDVARAPSLWISAYPDGRTAQGLYRPLTATTYLVDHALWGLDGGRFHLTNVLLHAIASGLFALVLLRLGAGHLAALAGGLLFAVHAVHVEAVAWVVGRAEVLAGLFCFATVLAWIAHRRGGGAVALIAASVAWFFGMAAKETAAPLLGVLVLGDALGVFARGTERTSRRRLAMSYLALAPALLLYVGLRAVALDGDLGVGKTHRIFFGETTATRFATALAAIGREARLLAWPVGLRVDHGDLMTDRFISWRVLAGLVVVTGIVSAIWFLRRRRPVPAFWIGWTAIIMLPFTNLVIQIGTVLAERILYVPSAGACALVGMLLGREMGPARGTGRRIGAAAVLGAMVVGLSILTTMRIADWRNEERFWRSALAASPASEKVHINLAGILWDRAEATNNGALREESDELLRRGIDLYRPGPRGYSRAHVHMRFNLANHLRGRGRLDEALPHYERVTEILVAHPEFDYENRAEAFVDHGTALRERGRLDDAAALCRRGIEARPEFALAHEHLAFIEHLRGDAAAAIEAYGTAFALAPRRADLAINLAQLLERAGRPADAALALTRLAENGGETAETAYRRGRLAQAAGDPDRARVHFGAALRLDPGHAAARAALAAIEENGANP